MKIALVLLLEKNVFACSCSQEKIQFVLQSLDERFKNVRIFDFALLTFLARCESIQHPQTLTTGDLSPYKQNMATRFCTSCVSIQNNDTGIKCNKKQLLKRILKHDLG